MAESSHEKASPPGGFRERQRSYVRRCRNEDHAAVTAFRRAMFGVDAFTATPEVTEWFSRLPEAGGSPLWIFERQGIIQGHQVVVPTPVWIRGRRAEGAFGTHLVVEPALRARGIGAILSEVTLGDCPLAYGLDVSDPAAAALGRLGWLDLGTLPLYVAVLRPGPFVRGYLHASRRRTEAFLAATILNTPFGALQLGTAAAQRLRGFALRPVDRFDERVDAIWERSARHYPVICGRTAARLNWAFADFPLAGRYRLYYLERRGEPVAYAVLRAEERRGEKVAVLVDFLAPPATLVDLMRCVCVQAWRDGACALYCTCSSRACASLRRAGMFRRDSGLRAMVAPTRVTAAEREAVSDLGNWFFTSGDGNLDRPREGLVYAE
jgi:hypothetical protein